MTGIELIAAERARQVEEKGYTAEHDDKHVNNELAWQASHLAIPDKVSIIMPGVELTLHPEMLVGGISWFKRQRHVRICQLTAAGALIAAEIDRIQRAETKEQTA